ncbi:hypothetical protein Gorai_016787, partial [Gossypium raimondii]|nr:hypothetical protein [Gossypium raimondii]
DHVEGYLELSAKPKIYFATAPALWDADFYVKVDENVHVNIGMFYTSLLMRMFHWDHGLLDLMSSILMIRDYVVADHLIVSRRPKLAMLLLLPLIRAAVEFASMLMRLKRFISSAGKERMLCGVLLSNGSQHPVFFLTQEDGMH